MRRDCTGLINKEKDINIRVYRNKKIMMIIDQTIDKINYKITDDGDENFTNLFTCRARQISQVIRPRAEQNLF